MYIRLIRNEAKGNAITGRLVIDGRWFCYTLERKGVEIPALCYHVAVTMSPKFKRLLPLICGVPRTMSNVESQKSKVNETSAVVSPDFKHSTLDIKQSAMRSGIRIHRGSKPEHSSGCVLVVGDNKNDNTDVREAIVRPTGDKNLRPNRTRSDRSNACEIRIPLGAQGEYSSPRQEVLISPKGSNDRSAYDCRGMLSPLSSNNNHSLSSNKNIVDIVENKNIVVSSSLEGVDSSEILSKLSSKHLPVGCRSAADVEQELTSLILKAQQEHEEIILEVTDFTPGTQYGYDHPCPPELQER